MTNDGDDNNDEGYCPVKSRLDAEIEAIAGICLEAAEADGPMPNIIAKIKAAAEKFRVSRGLKIIVLEDDELSDREAEAHLEPPMIRIRKSVYDAAVRGVSRYVMTIAHEFGHIILEHKGHARPRRLNEAPRHKAFKPYEDAEHQAKVFAASFLIPKSLVVPGMSAKEMQVRFGVSREAAEIRHQQIFGTPGKKLPLDIKNDIQTIRQSTQTPRQREETVADRLARIQDEIDHKWECLERIPGEDPAVLRKARGFAVRKFDYLNARSDYGWCLSHGEIRAYRDLKSQ